MPPHESATTGTNLTGATNLQHFAEFPRGSRFAPALAP